MGDGLKFKFIGAALAFILAAGSIQSIGLSAANAIVPNVEATAGCEEAAAQLYEDASNAENPPANLQVEELCEMTCQELRGLFPKYNVPENPFVFWPLPVLYRTCLAQAAAAITPGSSISEGCLVALKNLATPANVWQINDVYFFCGQGQVIRDCSGKVFAKPGSFDDRNSAELKELSDCMGSSLDLTKSPPELQMTPTPQLSSDIMVGGSARMRIGTWDPGVAISMQWLRDGQPIVGANQYHYEITADDLNHKISAQVTGTKPNFTTTTKTSEEIEISQLGGILLKSPQISGQVQVGETITAVVDTSDPGISYTYQWRRDGVNIEGATSASYTLTTEDVNKTIYAWILASKFGYQSTFVNSPEVRIKFYMPLAPTPKIAGTPALGQTLSADLGTWAPGTNISVQWMRDGFPIITPLRPTYKVQAADVGHNITIIVRANLWGYEDETKTSSPVFVPAAKMAVSEVNIIGLVKIGNTVSASSTIWAPSAIVTYQWLIDGKNITGGTSQTFKILPSLTGRQLSVRISQTSLGYDNEVKTSSAVLVQPAKMVVSKAKISGLVKVGKSVSVANTLWAPSAKVSYQWLVDGKSIKGGTSKTYKIPSSLKGKKLSVKVTQTSLGYTTATATTSAVKVS